MQVVWMIVGVVGAGLALAILWGVGSGIRVWRLANAFQTTAMDIGAAIERRPLSGERLARARAAWPRIRKAVFSLSAAERQDLEATLARRGISLAGLGGAIDEYLEKLNSEIERQLANRESDGSRAREPLAHNS